MDVDDAKVSAPGAAPSRELSAEHLASQIVNKFTRIQQWRGTTWDAEVLQHEIEQELEAYAHAVRQEAERREQELMQLLEYCRSIVADGVTSIKKAVQGREWLTEGRGPYEWDDDRWHSEFAAAAKEILDALEPLAKEAADWSNCPKIDKEVAEARINLKAKVASLTAERDALLRNWKEQAKSDQSVIKQVGAERDALKEEREIDKVKLEVDGKALLAEIKRRESIEAERDHWIKIAKTFGELKERAEAALREARVLLERMLNCDYAKAHIPYRQACDEMVATLALKAEDGTQP